MKELPHETQAFFRWLLIQIGEATEEDFAPERKNEEDENYDQYETED